MATPYAAPIAVANARKPPSLPVVWAIAAAGLATAGAALALALASDDVSGIQIALLEWISVPYIAAGLIAWRSRPDSRLGVLMIAGGFTTAVSALAFADYAVPHTFGVVFDILPAVIFVHVYLAFPSGRLRSSSPRCRNKSTRRSRGSACWRPCRDFSARWRCYSPRSGCTERCRTVWRDGETRSAFESR